MSNGRLRDKVAIVTGSTVHWRGPGHGVRPGGAEVVVCGRSAERGAELAKAINA